MIAARSVYLTCLLGLACLPGLAAQPEGGNPCTIIPWQTVDNGLGAETGVVREFASRISMPPGCLRGGRVWVPRIHLGLTRTAAGASDMDVRVSIRPPQPPGLGPGGPGGSRTDPATHTLPNVPVFPMGTTYEVATGPNSNQNINDLVFGDTFFVSLDMDGDETMNQFMVADETGPVDQNCFTGIDGATPADPCTTGNPNLSAAALGATGYTFYGRFPHSGAETDGREPLAGSWAARYLGAFPGTTNLRVWRDSSELHFAGGQTICQFFDIPADFEFQCPMSATELDLLAAGRIFVELTEDGNVNSVRMIPADLFLFADGFESGDTTVWSATVQ
ncbi:MAG: hypothetical protein O7A98_02230 [Acidobacteria bacterium]|nr:hypothetical protein [Acidobacteriota bacterium]